MTATRKDIDGWLDKLYDPPRFYTHMIVFCDTWDYDNYPVYVGKEENVSEVIEDRDDGWTLVDEVYSRDHDRAAQMAEFRAYHVDD